MCDASTGCQQHFLTVCLCLCSLRFDMCAHTESECLYTPTTTATLSHTTTTTGPTLSHTLPPEYHYNTPVYHFPCPPSHSVRLLWTASSARVVALVGVGVTLQYRHNTAVTADCDGGREGGEGGSGIVRRKRVESATATGYRYHWFVGNNNSLTAAATG